MKSLNYAEFKEQVFVEKSRNRFRNDLGELEFFHKGLWKRETLNALFPWRNPEGHLIIKDLSGETLDQISRVADLDSSSQKVVSAHIAGGFGVFDVTEILSVEEKLELRIWILKTKDGKRILENNSELVQSVLSLEDEIIERLKGRL